MSKHGRQSDAASKNDTLNTSRHQLVVQVPDQQPSEAAAQCFPARSVIISLFAFTAHLQWQLEPEMLPCVTSWAEALSAAVFMALFKKNSKNWESAIANGASSTSTVFWDCKILEK